MRVPPSYGPSDGYTRLMSSGLVYIKHLSLSEPVLQSGDDVYDCPSSAIVTGTVWLISDAGVLHSNLPVSCKKLPRTTWSPNLHVNPVVEFILVAVMMTGVSPYIEPTRGSMSVICVSSRNLKYCCVSTKFIPLSAS